MIMQNETDFQRPRGISQGILLNTNNEALQRYKKTKERFKKMSQLQEEVDDLKSKFEILLKKLDDRITNTD